MSGVIKRHAVAFESLLELRDVDDGAETASADEAGVAFEGVGSDDVFLVIIDVTALDHTTGDETYDFVVDVDSLAAFSDAPVEVARLTFDGANTAGRIIIPVHGLTVNKLDPNAAAIRVGMEASGTTPSITYGAFVAKA